MMFLTLKVCFFFCFLFCILFIFRLNVFCFYIFFFLFTMTFLSLKIVCIYLVCLGKCHEITQLIGEFDDRN